MGNKSSDGGGGGGNNPPAEPQTQKEPLTWESAKDDPEKLAEMSNMVFTVDKDSGDYLFNDTDSGLELRIEKDVLLNHGNDGYLNRIVRAVSELPDINKQSTPEIVVVQNDYSPVYGLHASANPISGNHIVSITTSAFRSHRGHSLERTLFHETEHAHDFMMGDYKSRGGISSSKAFKDALKEEGPATRYSQKFKYGKNYRKLSDRTIYRKNHDYLLENYAEAASIVKMQMSGRGSEEILLPTGKFTTVKNWCATHPKTTKVVADHLKDTPNNFQKTEQYYSKEIKRDCENYINPPQK